MLEYISGVGTQLVASANSPLCRDQPYMVVRQVVAVLKNRGYILPDLVGSSGWWRECGDLLLFRDLEIGVEGEIFLVE